MLHRAPYRFGGTENVEYFLELIQVIVLAFFHRGAGGAPLRQFSPLRDFSPSEILAENNTKISITKNLHNNRSCPPPPKKIPGRKPEFEVKIFENPKNVYEPCLLKYKLSRETFSVVSERSINNEKEVSPGNLLIIYKSKIWSKSIR